MVTLAFLIADRDAVALLWTRSGWSAWKAVTASASSLQWLTCPPMAEQGLNGVERTVVDLVQVAEAPLYSTYRWLGRQLGRQVSLTEFLALVQRLIDREALRLWSVDSTTHERRRLANVPSDLEQRYVEEGQSDERFDPFGLSLSLGAEADADEEPDWDVNLDFDAGRFNLTAKTGRETLAIEALGELIPDIEIVDVRRSVLNEDRVELNGSLRALPNTNQSS